MLNKMAKLIYLIDHYAIFTNIFVVGLAYCLHMRQLLDLCWC